MKAGEYRGGTHGERCYRWWVDSVGGVQHGLVLSTDTPADCAVDKTDLRPAAAALLALADELETEYVEFFDEHHRVGIRGAECWLEIRPPSGDWTPVSDLVRDWNRVRKHELLLAAFRAGQERGQR